MAIPTQVRVPETNRKCFLTSMIPNYKNLRFGIEMKFYLNQMGARNTLFANKSGNNFQGYGAVKLGRMHTSGDHYSSSHGQMENAS